MSYMCEDMEDMSLFDGEAVGLAVTAGSLKMWTDETFLCKLSGVAGALQANECREMIFKALIGSVTLIGPAKRLDIVLELLRLFLFPTELRCCDASVVTWHLISALLDFSV
ncbi:hypothetical protein LDENG_00295570 [Lucifuga dentata]|nr:hypothetical protein LDENG_00295570 [Lucifuga dentata]